MNPSIDDIQKLWDNAASSAQRNQAVDAQSKRCGNSENDTKDKPQPASQLDITVEPIRATMTPITVDKPEIQPFVQMTDTPNNRPVLSSKDSFGSRLLRFKTPTRSFTSWRPLNEQTDKAFKLEDAQRVVSAPMPVRKELASADATFSTSPLDMFELMGVRPAKKLVRGSNQYREKFNLPPLQIRSEEDKRRHPLHFYSWETRKAKQSLSSGQGIDGQAALHKADEIADV
ncbi:hypothetical protein MBLNU459_g6125t3 [Dothideomycetes sp. NU459]